ncbi:hypothetical protein I3843_07G114600 [Carya illinoinensis]|uniref:Uncharacterized protein n=1 Tax=Carya illinoinensis TaxID=32201 RepID=A0A8T1Q0J2_CARIL|nr:uncharacterized protein LOC122316888 [Carya illinoinensis]KAG2697620.1 hypothetical protein I3760_07G115100 [Carya illinoinensis]KAG6647988.1 hypothetical protein CIPAW_07G116400 [Carya illinoinensis]KAG6704096.1 hypothetical protein I3842_07G119300 [Carya illinoinensis]KAG7971017.1 hypothetical protein I3843_07G114600 [Carya illinoinensis]
MGNYASCYFPSLSKSEKAKLFDAHGNYLQQVKLPVKAAELMLEHPGHAIVPVEELRRTRCISAIRADDGLLGGKVYFLVPSGRVHCRISELEMMIIELACKKKARKLKPSGSKVSPAMKMESKEVGGEGEGEVLGGEASGLPGHHLGNHRRWSPALEPIYEAF